MRHGNTTSRGCTHNSVGSPAQSSPATSATGAEGARMGIHVCFVNPWWHGRQYLSGFVSVPPQSATGGSPIQDIYPCVGGEVLDRIDLAVSLASHRAELLQVREFQARNLPIEHNVFPAGSRRQTGIGEDAAGEGAEAFPRGSGGRGQNV